MNSVVASHAQPQFKEIEGLLNHSLPSAADDPKEAANGIYRPGVFYFRRDLRRSCSRGRAIQIGEAVRGELERTRAWLIDGGVRVPEWIAKPGVPALSGCESHEAAIAVGLIIIGGLERQRAWLWEMSLEVPKWTVSPDEVTAWEGSA